MGGEYIGSPLSLFFPAEGKQQHWAYNVQAYVRISSLHWEGASLRHKLGGLIYLPQTLGGRKTEGLPFLSSRKHMVLLNFVTNEENGNTRVTCMRELF